MGPGRLALLLLALTTTLQAQTTAIRAGTLIDPETQGGPRPPRLLRQVDFVMKDGVVVR